MMDREARSHAEEAVSAIDSILKREDAPSSREVSAAIGHVFALRSHMIVKSRREEISRPLLDRTNAIASLAYGAENPVIGVHRHRLEQTRDELRSLLEHH